MDKSRHATAQGGNPITDMEHPFQDTLKNAGVIIVLGVALGVLFASCAPITARLDITERAIRELQIEGRDSREILVEIRRDLQWIRDDIRNTKQKTERLE